MSDSLNSEDELTLGCPVSSSSSSLHASKQQHYEEEDEDEVYQYYQSNSSLVNAEGATFDVSTMTTTMTGAYDYDYEDAGVATMPLQMASYDTDDYDDYYATSTLPLTPTTALAVPEAQFQHPSVILQSKSIPDDIAMLRSEYDRRLREKKQETTQGRIKLADLKPLTVTKPRAALATSIPLRQNDIPLPNISELAPIIPIDKIPISCMKAPLKPLVPFTSMKKEVATPLLSLKPLTSATTTPPSILNSVVKRVGGAFFGATSPSPLGQEFNKNGFQTKMDLACHMNATDRTCPKMYVQRHRGDLFALWVAYDTMPVVTDTETALVILPSEGALEQAIESYSTSPDARNLIRNYLAYHIVPNTRYEDVMRRVESSTRKVAFSTLLHRDRHHHHNVYFGLNEAGLVISDENDGSDLHAKAMKPSEILALSGNDDIYPSYEEGKVSLTIDSANLTLESFLHEQVHLLQEGGKVATFASLEDDNKFGEFVSMNGASSMLKELAIQVKTLSIEKGDERALSFDASDIIVAPASASTLAKMHTLLSKVNETYLPQKQKHIAADAQTMLKSLQTKLNITANGEESAHTLYNLYCVILNVSKTVQNIQSNLLRQHG